MVSKLTSAARQPGVVWVEPRVGVAVSFSADAGAIARSRVGSLDHVIRPQQQRRRDREAERLGGLEVDDEFELGGLFDG